MLQIRQICHNAFGLCRSVYGRGFLFSWVLLALVGSVLRGKEDSTLSVDVNVVNVLATVRNKQGQIVRDLNQGDFKLEEDGRPQTIRYFARETNLPLTLGLLVDTSLSQRRLLGEERTASYQFLQQVLREDKDMAFVLHFDREVELLQDITSSHKRLETALGSLETPAPGEWRGRSSPGSGPRSPGPGGPRPRGRMAGTLLYDAVFLASDELMKKQTGRKALIILSDGVDTGSKLNLQSAIEAAQRVDTPVYAILFADEAMYASGGGFGGGHHPGGMGRWPDGRSRFPQQTHPDGKKVLKELAQETGGGFFEVSKKQSIEQIYTEIQEELRNQYSLGYTPDRTKGNPGYHKIHLATQQKGLIVQARDGYYANW
jgi:VWFA-related protein